MLVFVFVDMVALTFLYAFVFFYIRGQLKKFSVATSSGERGVTGSAEASSAQDQELALWQADLESGTPISEVQPSQIMTTQMVSVTTEERNTHTITAEGPISLRNTPNNQSHLLARRRMLQVARSLLWYPMIYLLVTAPLTIVRLASFAGANWPATAIFIGAAFYACGGWCNVLLYTTTRKGIIGWQWFGLCGLVRNRKNRKFKSSPSNPSSPKTPNHPKNEKMGSHNSTQNSSGSSHSPDGTKRFSPSSSSPIDTTSDLNFEGVDFTHATGFDTINNNHYDSKVVHDRYCIQTRLNGTLGVAESSTPPGSSNTVCTCKNIPTKI